MNGTPEADPMPRLRPLFRISAAGLSALCMFTACSAPRTRKSAGAPMSCASSPTPKAACAQSGHWPKLTKTGWRQTATWTTCASTRRSHCAEPHDQHHARPFLQNLTHTTSGAFRTRPSGVECLRGLGEKLRQSSEQIGQTLRQLRLVQGAIQRLASYAFKASRHESWLPGAAMTN